MSARFRDPVARDKAWGRHYAKRGLAPATKSVRPIPGPVRRAVYETRKALSTMIRC